MSFSHPIDAMDNKAKQKHGIRKHEHLLVLTTRLRTNSILFMSLHGGRCRILSEILFVAGLDEPDVGHCYTQSELEVVLANQFIVGGSALAGFQR